MRGSEALLSRVTEGMHHGITVTAPEWHAEDRPASGRSILSALPAERMLCFRA